MDLQAGTAVGPFKLGMKLWDCINHLRASSTPANISWDSNRPSLSYILVTATSSSSITLVFSGRTQRLLTCQITPPSIASLTWQGKPLLPIVQSEDENFNIQRYLHSRFGPTYAPTPHPSFEDELVLAYPGLFFGFAVEPDKGKGKQEPPLRRVLIAAPHRYSDRPPPFPDILQTGPGGNTEDIPDGQLAVVKITLGGQTVPTKITLWANSQDERTEPIELALHESSSEDLLCDLGAPTRTYWKEDDRLAIHTKQSRGPNAPNAYFYNYFSLGLDFMLDPITHKVIKIILHANTPGEVLFGRYAKCRWQLSREGSDNTVSSEDEVEQVESFLVGAESTPAKEPSRRPRQEQAMILDRAADSRDGLKLERPTELHAYPGAILEITQSGEVETLWLV